MPETSRPTKISPSTVPAEPAAAAPAQRRRRAGSMERLCRTADLWTILILVLLSGFGVAYVVLGQFSAYVAVQEAVEIDVGFIPNHNLLMPRELPNLFLLLPSRATVKREPVVRRT